MTTLPLEDYNIYVGDCWEAFNGFLADSHYSKVFVIVDENTEQLCLPKLKAHCPTLLEAQLIRVTAGEQHKNIESCQHIWSTMMAAKADRKALTVNLGGGVIGDMGGFCASTFKRGMDFVQVPTTLLSQVDASIGGKLGIDFADVKNSVGLFANPKAVFVLPNFLETLSARELRSGFAEIIKHALIADHRQWMSLLQEEDLQQIAWEQVIVHSLGIKQRVVEEDPFERGLRKALNFGHTIGHAVESQALHSDDPLLHGEAIAVGMVAELFLSHKVLGLPLEKVQQATDYLLTHYGRRRIDLSNPALLLSLMRNDKKNEGGKINFSLLPELGQVQVNQTCEEALILESLNFYQDSCHQPTNAR
ncbi:MAG: 3-dehydroquinate synthase [Bacteroidota bacterium]